MDALLDEYGAETVKSAFAALGDRAEALIRAYCESGEVAVIWISHDPEQVARVGCRALYLENGRLRSELNEAIWWALNAAGIVIAFPQRDVHLDTRRPLEVRIQPSSPQTE